MEKYIKNWLKFQVFVSILGFSLYAISFYGRNDDYFYSTFYKVMYVQRIFAYIIGGLIGISGLYIIGLSILRARNVENNHTIKGKEDISITEKNKKFWIKISVLLVPEIIFASLWALNYMHLSELIQILQNLTFSDPVPGVYYYIHYQSSDVSYSVGFWVVSLLILTVIIERWAPWFSNNGKNERVNYRKIGLVKNGMMSIEDLKDIRTSHEPN